MVDTGEDRGLSDTIHAVFDGSDAVSAATPAERIGADALAEAVSGALREIASRFLAEPDGARELRDWKWRVCESVNVDQRTLERWIGRETTPDALSLLRLCALFGPNFANRITSLAGLETAFKADAGTVKDANELRRLRKALGEIARVAAAAKDGEAA